MPQNICFKPKSTPAERQECYEWFEQRMDRLPKEMNLSGLNILDLPRFVQHSIRSLKTHLAQSPIYEGQFSLLLFVLEMLRKDPNFEE
ncbi:MAG: hypothetical protein IJ066_11340 [Bacteroidaceae bacterium]|nr:hypothetical protein [Bacteroidaceae bacterium]